MRMLRSTVLSLLALPLAAQGFSVTGSLINGFDSLRKATNATLAAGAGVDYDTRLYGTEIPARAGLAFAFMPGKERFGLKTSLNLAQAHGDVFIATSSPALRGFLGLSLNSYSMSTSGTENTSDALDIDHHFPMHSTKGVKLGFRLGAEYRLTPSCFLELMLQQTELAGKDLTGDVKTPAGDELVRQGAVNPAWLQLGFTYRF